MKRRHQVAFALSLVSFGLVIGGIVGTFTRDSKPEIAQDAPGSLEVLDGALDVQQIQGASERIPVRIWTTPHGALVSDTYRTHLDLVEAIRGQHHEVNDQMVREGRLTVIDSQDVGIPLERRGDAWLVQFSDRRGWVWDVYLDL